MLPYYTTSSRIWLLQEIAIANIVLCMAYKRGVGGGVVYCAIVVQEYCNSVGSAGGRGEHKDDWFVHKSLEVKEYLVKANLVVYLQTLLQTPLQVLNRPTASAVQFNLPRRPRRYYNTSSTSLLRYLTINPPWLLITTYFSSTPSSQVLNRA